jgi:hypothetical protein
MCISVESKSYLHGYFDKSKLNFVLENHGHLKLIKLVILKCIAPN